MLKRLRTTKAVKIIKKKKTYNIVVHSINIFDKNNLTTAKKYAVKFVFYSRKNSLLGQLFFVTFWFRLLSHRRSIGEFLPSEMGIKAQFPNRSVKQKFSVTCHCCNFILQHLRKWAPRQIVSAGRYLNEGNGSLIVLSVVVLNWITICNSKVFATWWQP